MNPKTLGLPLLLLGLVACESVDSTAVTTAGVYADITAMADGLIYTYICAAVLTPFCANVDIDSLFFLFQCRLLTPFFSCR